MGEAYNTHTITRKVYDDTNEAIRVNTVAGGGGAASNVTITDVDFTTTQTDVLSVRDIHAISSQGYGRITDIDNSGKFILVADTNSRDSGVLFANVGDYIVYLGFDASTTINNGMPLYPREKITIPTTNAIFGIIEEAAVFGEVSYMAV